MYSLQPENTDILQNNIKGYPSVTTLVVSYSAVVNQLAQQRLYHHIQTEFVVMLFEKCLYSQFEGECKYSIQLTQCTMDTVMYSRLCSSS